MAKQLSPRGGRAGNPELGKFPGEPTQPAPGKLPTRRVEHRLRSGWGDHLTQLDLPASRDQLIEQARAHGMDDEMIEVLSHMPESQYKTLDELHKGLGWDKEQ